MHILATGLSGMIGTTLTKLMPTDYQFENLSLETGVDIGNETDVIDRIGKSTAKLVIHFAALTDVDGCEKDKDAARSVNVEGTRHVANACSQFGKKLMYISTDFVFSGKSRTPYTEEDKEEPVNYYGFTKLEGEEIVKKTCSDFMIIRLAFPYGAQHPVKKDFVARLRERFNKTEGVFAIDDQIFTPTYLPDIANAIIVLIGKNANGIFHVVGSSSLSPFDAAVAIAKTFGYDNQLIQEIQSKEYYKEGASRPQFLALSNEKIIREGVRMRSFIEGLKDISNQT